MRIEVITTTAAYKCHRRRTICREKCHSELSGSLHGIKFPGILSVVHLLLVGSCLPASQIREHAWEDNLHKGTCGVKASKLPKEIYRQLCRRLAYVDTGIQINLSSDNRIVVANPGLATIEALQLEKLCRMCNGNIGVDINIQELVTAWITYCHQRLQRRIIE